MKRLFKSSIFSSSGAATVLLIAYIGSAVLSLYRLMYPMSSVDLSTYAPNQFVRPLWKQGEQLYLRVYLATSDRISEEYFWAGYEKERRHPEDSSNQLEEETDVPGDVALLWDETVNSPAFSKSFVLTVCQETNDTSCQEGPSFTYASTVLDHAEHAAIEQSGGGVLSVVASAGNGIESTSMLITFYQSLYGKLKALLGRNLGTSQNVETEVPMKILDRKLVHVSPSSKIWSSLQSNSTLYLHVLVLRANAVSLSSWPPATASETLAAVRQASRFNALLGGKVDLVKFDAPHHIRKPSRILYKDVLHLWRRFVLGSTDPPPWSLEHSNPEQHRQYQQAKAMKLNGSGYPYWKPEVSIKYVTDVIDYPLEYVGASGMPIVQLQATSHHPTGYSYTPVIHVDEIGLTTEKYIPINETLTSLPLRISFDRSDMEHKASATTGTAGGISPARWRLLSHLSHVLESQKAMGFDESDIDELRRLIADTNVTLLLITLLASSLHLLFEFLTFKNEVSFWKANKDLTGISVRSLFLDFFGQTIILLYLVEQESSLLITVPSAFGCLIALWKCQRAAGLKFVVVTEEMRKSRGSWWNVLPRLFGYEVQATRLQLGQDSNSSNGNTSEKVRLNALTHESDRIATRTLGVILLPVVVLYTLYQWAFVPQIGWYSWLVTSASSAVYALGFILMTPQLFLNWKLKSVAHLPWRVLVYKSLNTFIDDLFSFIIRMPTMARVSCFRDDVVFFIYLYQRWLYPVDASRPVEGGVGERLEEDSREKKDQ